MENNEHVSTEMWSAFVSKSMTITIWRNFVWFLFISSFLSYWWVPFQLANKITLTGFIICIITQIFTYILLQQLNRLFYLGITPPLKKDVKL